MPINPLQGAGSPSVKQPGQKPKQNPDRRGEERRDKDREDSAPVPPSPAREPCSDTRLSISEDAGKALALGPRLVHSALEGHGVYHTYKVQGTHGSITSVEWGAHRCLLL